MPESTSQSTLRFRLVKRESNLEQHIRWFEYLTGSDFIDDVKKSYEKTNNRMALVRVARQVVESEIYSKNRTDGTGNIKRSFKVAASSNKFGGLTLFSDPREAPSKAGQSPGKFSYAAFFEEPRFLSFLPPPDDPYSDVKYRPFWSPLVEAATKIASESHLDAVSINIKKRMPRK